MSLRFSAVLVLLAGVLPAGALTGCGSSSPGASATADGGDGGEVATLSDGGLTGEASAQPDAGPPVEAGVTSMGNQVSQYGVTWTFSDSATIGQFANGDYWVIGPVTITGITPDAAVSSGRSLNGWDVNPLPSNAQGYDSCAGDYSAADVPSLPYVAAPGSSIVKAVSAVPTGPGAGQPACVQTAAVLTVVDKAPPDNGSTAFRPPYVGPKTLPMTYYSVNDVKWTLLPSLTPTPSVSFFATDSTQIWS